MTSTNATSGHYSLGELYEDNHNRQVNREGRDDGDQVNPQLNHRKHDATTSYFCLRAFFCRLFGESLVSGNFADGHECYIIQLPSPP